MSQTIGDLARVIRSKNAGPFELTLDIIFPDAAAFDRVRESGVLAPARIARLYGLPDASVTSVHFFAPANAFKATLARPLVSGAVGDTDVYGSQQHMPLVDVIVPEPVAPAPRRR
jgi:hypothetical protein